MRKELLTLSALLVFAAFTVAGCNKPARTTTSGSPTTVQQAPTAPPVTAPASPSTK